MEAVHIEEPNSEVWLDCPRTFGCIIGNEQHCAKGQVTGGLLSQKGNQDRHVTINRMLF
jgi:hypothetical protein